MHLSKIAVKNFRLLEDVQLSLEQATTVIVGRNNSGKTSLTELFRRLLLGSEPTFNLEDFHLGTHEKFWEAFVSKCEAREESQIREALPIIEAQLTVSYVAASDFGPLSEFIADLDPNCTDALIIIRYQLKDGKIDSLFEDLPTDQSPNGRASRLELFRILKERVPKLYGATVRGVDPHDPGNERVQEWSKLKALLQTGFIPAQRGLDDSTHKTSEALSGILQDLFSNANVESATPEERTIAKALEGAVKKIQDEIEGDFKDNLERLLPTFELFGYPGLGDPRICTETTLNVDRLLTNHTRVRYAGANGVTLPEAYNGLGVRNLIYILLRVLQFFQEFRSKPVAPGVHLVFIEEPEVHLHPQMQEVFIRQLQKIVGRLNIQENTTLAWPVQFVITTHSSHIANEAPFNSIRYFLSIPATPNDAVRKTNIKDLRQGIGGSLKDDQEFLHEYLTLTRCDLFFADKAVLIEGASERLLLPRMIEKFDQMRGKQLSSKYISSIEIIGAYAHRFFRLLDFLELRALIITDLDSGKRNAKNRIEACRVSEGTHTTNACLTNWFGDPQISPGQLIQKTASDKTSGVRRLAYEVPETGAGSCGRSFEGAFMLANPNLFGLNGTQEEQEIEVWEKTRNGLNKMRFALDHAIEKTNWEVPRYLAEGLEWLADASSQPEASSPFPVGATPAPRAKTGQDA
ncbi:MAG: ATP-dependent nuclease [Candidatus Acidiferrales bacterium]